MRCQTAAASRGHWAADPRPHLMSLSWQLKVRQTLRPGYRRVRMWLLSASVPCQRAHPRTARTEAAPRRLGAASVRAVQCCTAPSAAWPRRAQPCHAKGCVSCLFMGMAQCASLERHAARHTLPLRHSPILPWLLGTVGRHTARKHSMRRSLGESDMLAYPAIITVPLIELHRVLKPTGSLYLHCDTTVRHYLKVLRKVLLDQSLTHETLSTR